MPRPRKFEESEVLRTALQAFWRNGYDATTYRELEKITGVGLRSLNNTFGEKDALFARVLEAYRLMVTGVMDQIFAEPGVGAIIAFLESVPAPTEDPDDPRNSGCLMVNSMIEIGTPAPEIAEQMALYREMFRQKFEASLGADGIADPETRAEYLVGSLWGMLTLIRQARSKSAAAPMARVLVETVRGWR